MTKKALVTAFTFRPEGIEKLQEAGYEVTFDPTRHSYSEEELLELVGPIDAYIAGVDPITRGVIDRAPNLRIIARCGVGYDSVDWRYAREKGIPVTLTPGTNETSVAEMVFALLLGLARKIPLFDRTVREGGWHPQLLGTELTGKTIGIVGTGRIGKAVARRARGFDMTPVAYDPFRDADWAERAGVTYVAMEELLRRSDVVTLHSPLTPETERMVDAAFLRQMKRTAFLINTARGKLVDEEALAAALADGSIAGAALDVFDREPLMPGHPLLGLDSTVLTHHVSSHTVEAMARMSLMCAEEVLRVDRGEEPLHAVRDV